MVLSSSFRCTASGCAPDSAVPFLCFAKEKEPKGLEEGVRSLGKAKLRAHQRRPRFLGPLRGLPCAAHGSREVQKLALRAQTSELLFPPPAALLSSSQGARRTNTTRLAAHRRGSQRVDHGDVWRSQTSRLLVLALGVPVGGVEQRRARRIKKFRCLSVSVRQTPPYAKA
jgi:hypothetical protein